MTLATSSDVTGMPSCRDGPGLDSIDLQRSLYHANSSTWMFWWGWTLGLGQISKFPLRQVGHFRSKGVFFFVVWSCYSSKNAAMFFLCHMMFGYKKLQPTGFWREDHLGKSRSISSWPQVRRFEPLQSCRLVFFFCRRRGPCFCCRGWSCSMHPWKSKSHTWSKRQTSTHPCFPLQYWELPCSTNWSSSFIFLQVKELWVKHPKKVAFFANGGIVVKIKLTTNGSYSTTVGTWRLSSALVLYVGSGFSLFVNVLQTTGPRVLQCRVKLPNDITANSLVIESLLFEKKHVVTFVKSIVWFGKYMKIWRPPTLKKRSFWVK